MESEFEYLDSATIRHLRELMGARFDVLLTSYVTDCQQRLNHIDAAMAETNVSAVAQQAHSLKGSNMNMGCKALVRLCRDVEESAHAGDMAELLQNVSSLQQVFAATRREIDSLLDETR